MRSTQPHRGFTLAEVLVASIVLGAVILLSVRLLSALALERSEAQHRLCALSEAGNWLERLTIQPWDELTPQRTADYELSDETAEQLLDGKLSVEVADVDEQPPAKRVSVEVRWRSIRGQPLAPVRLTAWVYQRDVSQARGEQ